MNRLVPTESLEKSHQKKCKTNIKKRTYLHIPQTHS